MVGSISGHRNVIIIFSWVQFVLILLDFLLDFTFVISAPGAVAIAAGNMYTCGVLSSGAVYCMGDNMGGQLGTGDVSGRQTPTTVVELGAGCSRSYML